MADSEGLTLSGVLVGTPSYMAPEQARGDRGATIGPATDVYALGVILYELLTGRPPFRGETATATLLQVVADEPVPPARLNPAVPRDLQTICLKCLHKAPQRRYASAQALADDLRRFERGEPITARPVGPLERAAKWARRRPTAAALLAAGLLVLAGITAAAVWYADDRAQRRAEVEHRGRQVNRDANAALDQAEQELKDLRAQLDDEPRAWQLFSDIDRWHAMVEQAGLDLRRAKSASAENEGLLAEQTRERIQAVDAAVAREQAAYGLAKELDTLAVEVHVSRDSGGSQYRKAAAEYERLFFRQGLDIHQPGTDGFASAIQSSPARFALIAALDNWAWLVGVINVLDRVEVLTRQGVADRKAWLAGLREDPQLARLLELARAADPDPWRDAFRDPDVWTDRATLIRLANKHDVGRQSPTLLTSLGTWLASNEGDATALYERVLLDHPRDFWLHVHAALLARDPGTKVGLALAAIAIRPQHATGFSTLAGSLQDRGDWPESLVAAKRAIAMDQNETMTYFYLGRALQHERDLAGAVAAFQRSIDLDPAGFVARHSLAQVLQQQGRYGEAEQAYLGTIKAQPTHFAVATYDSLARLLATCPDDKVRDGNRAIEYATKACEWTAWKNPMYLDTLAAAYAAAGQFENAVRYQTRVLEDPALKDDFRTAAKERLELYRQKKPFRDQGP
jgi:serine/threonine-protein kinase